MTRGLKSGVRPRATSAEKHCRPPTSPTLLCGKPLIPSHFPAISWPRSSMQLRQWKSSSFPCERTLHLHSTTVSVSPSSFMLSH